MINNININLPANSIQIRLSRKIYDLNAVKRVSFLFSDRYFINIDMESAEIIMVTFTLKPECPANLSSISSDFKNSLLEQQIRSDLEVEHAHMRELIVNQAFSSIER